MNENSESGDRINRDLAIDAAVMRLAVKRDPNINGAGIQRRGSTVVFDRGYNVLMDERLLAVVTLQSDSRFTIDVTESDEGSGDTPDRSSDPPVLEFLEREVAKACDEVEDEIDEAIRNRLCYVLIKARKLALINPTPQMTVKDCN